MASEQHEAHIARKYAYQGATVRMRHTSNAMRSRSIAIAS